MALRSVRWGEGFDLTIVRCPGIWAATAAAVVIFAGTAVAADKKANDVVENTTAERLVRQSAEARIKGDTARCIALLREATSAAPDYQPARWQLGQIAVDGEWVAVEEAQRRAATDPHQSEYRERRKALGETPEGQLAIARWCRRAGLADEAVFHWASVLSVDPTNEEALRAVDMRWQNGRLLTRDDIARLKKEWREFKQADKKWSPKIARWRRAISSSDASRREAALDEIRSLTDIAVVPSLEEITLGREAKKEKQAEERRLFSAAFLEALARMPDQAATESIARHAVFSSVPDARNSAIQELKSRPPHDYVPMLLSGLAMPVESSFSVRTEPDGSVHYRHSLYREGPVSDWSFDTRLSAMQNDLGGRHYIYDVASNTVEIGPPNGARQAELAKKAYVTSRYANGFGNAATATEWQVWQINQMTEALNTLIMQVLAGATELGLESPKAWWEWWRNYNEYYAGEHPVHEGRYSDTDSFYYGFPSYETRFPPPPPRPLGMSCFAKGTPVWTKTGQRPIETLELGDLVLAQNIDTGELMYKPVIGRTVRPPSEILKLSFGPGELLTTKGHPLWVAGVGWRMAKELGEGAILHSVTGATRVETVESAGEAEAYNLVVADINTYFVGDAGVLVHDNTSRAPTRAIVPGLVAK